MDAWGPASTVPASVVASAGEEARCSLGCYDVCSFLSRKTADFCWLLSSESVRLVGSWLFTGGTLGAVRPLSPSHGETEARRGGRADGAPLRAPVHLVGLLESKWAAMESAPIPAPAA